MTKTIKSNLIIFIEIVIFILINKKAVATAVAAAVVAVAAAVAGRRRSAGLRTRPQRTLPNATGVGFKFAIPTVRKK